MLNEESVVGEFNVRHTAVVDCLALLSFMPRTFSPRVADAKQEKRSKRMSLDSSSPMLKSVSSSGNLRLCCESFKCCINKFLVSFKLNSGKKIYYNVSGVCN